jgi:membrane protease YdiL (CAAX protease family)
VLVRASTAGAAALLVASCVLAPLIEETIYRGVLLAALRGPLGGLGPGASVAVAAAAFAASHAAVAPGDLAALAALGAVLGAVRLGPGGLAAAALAHGLYNLGAFSVALADAAPR